MLTFGKLVIRSLRFHGRSHLGTFLGIAIASAVLIGALAVGDSVRQSLLRIQLARLGSIDFAMASQDRFFQDKLATSFSNSAPVLILRGTAASSDGSARANQVQVLGVDNRFWSLSTKTPTLDTNNASISINQALSEQIHIKIGDEIVVRMQKPSALPAETPLAVQEGTSLAARWRVGAILTDEEMGRFGLQSSQIPPFSVFIPITELQGKVGLTNKANLLLVHAPESNGTHLDVLLRQKFTLADAEMRFRPSSEGLELIGDRIFLDDLVVKAALSKQPAARPISTYFVNEIRDGQFATPYSTFTARGLPIVPAGLHDDEIILNQWLADDLQAKPGDQVAVKYFTLGQTRRLEEKQNQFRVHSIIPLNPVDRSLMPEFPGLAKAEKTENWDAGFPLEMDRIRPKDEQYWKDYRGTPKAFVTLSAGQKMWGNRFGDITAIRFPDLTNSVALEKELLKDIDPATLGFSFQPVRQQAIQASSQAQDFGELFISFSFFLIFAALLLVALLFQFGLEARTAETGLYLALGFRPRQVRTLMLTEGAVIAVLALLPGVVGGLFYAKGILYALRTIWQSAVGTSALQFNVTLTTLGVGVISSLLVSVAVIWLALRNQAKRPARELLEQGAELELAGTGKKPKWPAWVAVGSAAGALFLVGGALRHRDAANAPVFFASGALLLISGLSWVAVWLRKIADSPSRGHLTIATLALRGCARRPRRSLATIALLASGVFLIVAIQSNKLDASRNPHLRSSGTGGFAYIAQSALPVVQDLNTKSGRDFYGLDELSGVEVVPFRVRDGDEASCLNLNRAQTPRLLGVNPDFLQSRGAFTFASTLTTATNSSPWALLRLNEAQTNAIVPAIADEASILWALHKKIGDVIDYKDEKGNTFQIQLVGALANSILQGNLIIDEAQFIKRFPNETGYRQFLVDAPTDSPVASVFSRALQDVGLEMTPASKRLDAFNAVQNTYLDTFLILGGLGLLLGSAGLGAVVLRNVLERRSETAILLATGFTQGRIQTLILGEHALLLVLGLSLGTGTALISVLPSLLGPTSQIPWVLVISTLGAVLCNGFFWCWAALRMVFCSNQTLRQGT